MRGVKSGRIRPKLGGAALALALALAVGLGPASSPVAAAPPLRYLNVGAMGSPLLGVVGVDRSGALSSVPGSPFATGMASLATAITPDGRTVYSAHMVPGTIIGYRQGPDGSLTRIDGATIVTGDPVVGMAITPDGSRMFASVGQGQVELRSWSIASSGALTPTGARAVPIDEEPSTFSQVAITPDARHLVLSNWQANTVSSYAIGPDASLTPVGPPVPTGEKPVMPVFTPDGRYVYISDEGATTISGYAVGPDGRLTPTPGSPYESGGGQPHGVAITPDGRRLYLADSGNGTIPGFAIGSDGWLTPLPGSPFRGTGYLAGVGRVVLSPDARRLFAVESISQTHGTSLVYTHVVNPDGSLAPSGYLPGDSGVIFHDGTTAYLTPNQGPVAALRVVAPERGLTRTFSADGSRDADGTVAGYRWDFGDGGQEITSTPSVTHRYREPGRWAVTVTVTDDEGCSTEQVYNGTTVVCGGGPRAVATQSVEIGRAGSLTTRAGT